MDVAVKDNNEAVHNINTDVLADSSETQIIKIQMGNSGVDEGFASSTNPLFVADALTKAVLEAINGKISINEDGRIMVASKPAIFDVQTKDITANAQTFPIDVTTVSNIMVHCKVNPSVAGHNSTFEGSLNSTNGIDGSWFTVQAVRSNANTIETTSGVLAATPIYCWELSVNALKWFRIRTTAHTSGTMQWMVQCGSYATEPIPAIQTHAVTGTVTATANIGTCTSTIYADSTSNLTSSATFTGTARDAGTAPAFQTFIARAFSDQSGTLKIQDSTDNVTWRDVETKAIVAGVCSTLKVDTLARYYRVVVVNGAVATTAFRVTSGLQRI